MEAKGPSPDGEGHAESIDIMQHHTSLLRMLALGALACAAVIFPSSAFGASAESKASRSCINGKGATSSASAASAASRSTEPDANGERGAASSRRTAPPSGDMSSNVRVGPDGLTGTTTMPDGSTVTVTPRTGASASATSASGTSTGSATSAASASTTDDCADSGASHAPAPKRPQQQQYRNGRKPIPHKENQR